MPNALSLSAHEKSLEIERNAYNAAFYELGLRWHWDGPTYEALASDPCERSRVRGYLEAKQSHLLRAYEAEFLTDAILLAKARCRGAFPDPSPPAHFNPTVPHWAEVGF